MTGFHAEGILSPGHSSREARSLRSKVYRYLLTAEQMPRKPSNRDVWCQWADGHSLCGSNMFLISCIFLAPHMVCTHNGTVKCI